MTKKRAISIASLVETMWLTRYTRPTLTRYDQGSELIVHDIRKSLIEMEYGIIANTSTLVNPTSNGILERIHQVLQNLVRTYNVK